jgi:RND family efflux transporter MFP subunit
MSDTHTQPEGTSAPSRVKPTKALLQAGLLIVLVAVGWFFRGMMPSGKPMGPPGGGLPGAAGPPTVIVAPVEEGPANAPREFIGHVEAIQTVDVRAQVVGVIDTVHFEEGSVVTAGDLLFTIEQDRYKAQVALSEAAIVQTQANLEGAKADLAAAKADLDASRAGLDRAEKYLDRLKNADARSIVQADVDDAESQVRQGHAQVLRNEAEIERRKTQISQFEAAMKEANAKLDLARINLGYTEIRSPITGRIGKALVTKGNYVGPGAGTLARVVQTDPIRAVFSMSDRAFLAALQAQSGRRAFDYRVELRLPNGALYGRSGQWSYEDNEMDPTTGTIAIRVGFANPEGILVPQTYVTVILEDTHAEKVATVPQEAVMTGPEGSYVFVVDAEGKVEQRPVELGQTVGTHQNVRSGLALGEQVITQGTQKAGPGQKVAIQTASSGGGGQS